VIVEMDKLLVCESNTLSSQVLEKYTFGLTSLISADGIYYALVLMDVEVPIASEIRHLIEQLFSLNWCIHLCGWTYKI